MEVSIDLDVCCHLGFVKSIDMLDRGFYYIEVSLSYADRLLPIAPVGCFSAASTLTSKVRRTEINESILLNVCHTNETVNTFETRSFLIRYKDEIHELNEGCHWRLTLTKVDIMKLCGTSDNMLPYCAEDLSIKFILYRSEGVSYESSRDIEATCVDPEWEVVADQKLIIQYPSSGLHDYYPIRFKRYNFMNLDCMIHSAVTGIRLESVDLDEIMRRNKKMFKMPDSWSKDGLLRMYYFESSNLIKAAQINSVPKMGFETSSGSLTESAINDSPERDARRKRQALKSKHIVNNIQETGIAQDLGRLRQGLKSKQQIYVSSKIDNEASLKHTYITDTPVSAKEIEKVTTPVKDNGTTHNTETTEPLGTVPSVSSSYQSPSRKNHSLKPNLKGHSPMKNQPITSNRNDNLEDEDNIRLYQSNQLTSNQIFDNLTISPQESRIHDRHSDSKMQVTFNRELLSSSSVKRPIVRNLPEELVESESSAVTYDNVAIQQANRRIIPTTTYTNSHDSNISKTTGGKSLFGKVFHRNHPKTPPRHPARTATSSSSSADVSYISENVSNNELSTSAKNPLYQSAFEEIDTQKVSTSTKSALHPARQSIGESLNLLIEERLDRVSMIKLGNDSFSILSSEDEFNNIQTVDEDEMDTKSGDPATSDSTVRGNSTNGVDQVKVTAVNEVAVVGNVIKTIDKKQSESEDVALWRDYSKYFIINYYTFISGMNYILGISSSLSSVQQNEEYKSQWEKCPLELSDALIRSFKDIHGYPDFFDLFKSKIDKYNSYLSSRWSVFVTNLSQIMPIAVYKMRAIYFSKMERFWKKQTFAHNCSLQYFLLPYYVSDITSESYVTSESNHKADIQASSGRDQHTWSAGHEYTEDEMFACLHTGYMIDADNLLYSGGTKTAGTAADLGVIPPLRYGKGVLRVIDHTLKDDSKLPVMLVQQYTSPRMSNISFLPSDNLIFRGGDLLSPHDSQFTNHGSGAKGISTVSRSSSNDDTKKESIPTSAPSFIPKLHRASASRILTVNSFKTIDNNQAVAAIKKYAAYDVIDAKLLCHTYTRHAITSTTTAVRGSISTAASRGPEVIGTDGKSLHLSSSNDSSFSDNTKQIDADVVNNLKSDLMVLPTSSAQSSPSFKYLQRQQNLMNEPSHSPHLIVLQHGFLGTHYCMRLIQNAIAADMSSNRNVFILAAERNDDHNDEGITSMADRLAEEIFDYCQAKLPELLDIEESSLNEDGLEEDMSGRVSFICHSMGGLVVRKALEHKLLKPLIGKLHTYISLATPHLGTSFADSQLVKAGTWALFKWKGSEALKQLNLQDTKYLSKEETVVYKLSNNGVLGRFNKVVLVSSPKDMYCPRYSAAVRTNLLPKNIPVNRSKTVYYVQKMADNLLNQIDPDKLIRITLDNNEAGASVMDIGIGRAAHICYLDNPAIASQLLHTLLPLLV